MPKLPPEYGEGELTPLAGAKKEAEDIAHMLNTKALIGEEATETAVKTKLSEAKIIHLATYGLFDDIQGASNPVAEGKNMSIIAALCLLPSAFFGE